MADLLKKISDLASGVPTETDIIPYVDLVAGETKKALKSELKGIQGDAATVDAGTTTTLAAGESATVTNVGTTSAAIFNFAIPQGIQGLTGADGACVVSVSFVGNDMVFTLDDASTVTLTNAKTDLKGDTGSTGAKITSAEFVGDDLVFTLDDASTVTVTDAKLTLKGDTGNDGDAATIAVGTVTTVANNVPASVTNVGTSAAAIFDFEIPKGLDGTGSGDISGSGVANELAYFTAEKTIDNLAVSTYPSLTEVSYVKGVTSDIQTQLNGKQASLGFTAEDSANKENSTIDTSTTKYPTVNLLKAGLDAKINNSLVDAKGDIITATADNTPAKLTVGDNGKVLTANSSTATGLEWATPSAGGTSLWTAITGTRVSNTTCTVVGDQTAIFKKGMIIRWQESGVDKVAMVSIPSTVSTDTTITFIGDTMASIDSGTFKYSVILGVEPYIAKFAYAGTVGAVATDVMNAYYATEPMKVIGADLQVGTVASTSGTTTLDLNKNGTTFMTTKATLAYNVASSPTPFTADTATSLALGDKVTVDIDGVTSTTFPVDLYVQLYVFPTRFLTLS